MNHTRDKRFSVSEVTSIYFLSDDVFAFGLNYEKGAKS